MGAVAGVVEVGLFTRETPFDSAQGRLGTEKSLFRHRFVLMNADRLLGIGVGPGPFFSFFGCYCFLDSFLRDRVGVGVDRSVNSYRREGAIPVSEFRATRGLADARALTRVPYAVRCTSGKTDGR